MRLFLIIFLFTCLLQFLGQYNDGKRDPYEVGIHWNYSIKCENGFVYKTLDHNMGTIQVFNSDGTPLKCGKKIY